MFVNRQIQNSIHRWTDFFYLSRDSSLVKVLCELPASHYSYFLNVETFETYVLATIPYTIVIQHTVAQDQNCFGFLITESFSSIII